MATKNTNAPIVNDTLIDWVIKEEGFLDKPTNIGDGKITLGSGLTAQKWRDKYRKNGNKWTKQDNRAAVREELESRKRWAEDTIPNWENLPDDTKRAMLSYKYNYDFDAKNSPKLFSAMKSGDYIEAVRQMDATSKDPKFKKGLQERRNREQAWGLGALIGSNAPIYQEAPPIVEYSDNTKVFNPYTPLFENALSRPALIPSNPTTNYVEARQAEPEEWQQDDALAAFRMLERARNYRDSMLWENQPELPQIEYNPTEAPYLVTRYDEGGNIEKKKTWDELSVKEKADMMRVAVENGITSLSEIKDKYDEFAEGGDYTVGGLVDAIYKNNPTEEYLGEPEHHYDFTQSEEWADAHGYFPDARGHRDDRVKKPTHPSHPSRGNWKGNVFNLTEKGMQNPNYTIFGLVDGGQDPQAILTYNGGTVLPEITVTPNGNYIENPYDNIRLHYKALGGHIYDGTTEDSQQMETPTFWGGTLPEVEVAAPRKWFVGYDENGNPVYTTDYKQSQEYLQNQIPLSNIEQSRRQWAFENKEANGQVRPGLHGDAANLALAAELGIGTALAPLAAAPLAESLLPAAEIMARPMTTTAGVASKVLPQASKALPYTEMADRSLMGYLGVTGAYDTGKKWYNGELPWYEAVPRMGLDALMAADAAPVVSKGLDKAATFLASPYTGKWTTLGSKQYRLSPNSLGMNGVPIESRDVMVEPSQITTAYRTTIPKITPENAASITPEQWTAAQNDAIAKALNITPEEAATLTKEQFNTAVTKGVDMSEVQRLRDLHQSLTSTATPGKYYRGTKTKRNSYPDRHIDEEVGEMNGIYLTKKPEYAGTYGDVEEFYLRSNNPLETEGSWTGVIDDATRAEIEDAGYDAVVNNKFDTGFLNRLLRNSRDETITFDGRNLKLTDAVTYGDDGVRIPLGERDNFNIKDVRYGLLPFILGGTAAATK